MNALLQSPWIERIGWTLLHSLWQGVLIWSVAAGWLAMRPRLSAKRKHLIALLAVTLLVICPVMTLAWLGRDAGQSALQESSTFSKIETVKTVPQTSIVQGASERISPQVSTPLPAAPIETSFSWHSILKWLVGVWLGGVLLLSLRLILGWTWLRQLRRETVALDARQTGLLHELCRRFSLPLARVCLAPSLGVPLVVGWLRPVIHLPVSLMTGLKPEEVESVLLHELAHLKRHDPLLHLWITVVETLLFYHPAAHTLGTTARNAAEEACDDLVLQWTGDRRNYAHALASLEEWRGARLALAGSGGSLQNRLRHILQLPEESTAGGRYRFGIATLGGTALCLILCGVSVPQIAKAFTTSERVALIEKKQQEAHAGSPEAKQKKLIAIGQVHLPPGAKPAPSYQLHTFSHESNNSYSGIEQEIINVKTEGKGDQMMVGVLMKGFAPAMTSTSLRDPKTDRAKFDVTLEQGFPAVIRIVDSQGKPIPNASLNLAVAFPSGDRIYYNGGPFITDAEGQVSPGNVLASSRIEGEVLAHGYQWSNHFSIAFASGQPSVLKLAKAGPVVGQIVDASTKEPVAGCRAYCLDRNSSRMMHSYGGGIEGSPEMAATPSGGNGRLSLDVCHPEDEYHVVLSAPGYQRVIVKIAAGAHAFHAELKHAFTLSGVIRDPDHLLKPYKDRITCYVDIPRPGTTYRGMEWVRFPFDPAGIRFHFDQAPEGDFSLSCGPGKPWRIKMTQDVTDLEWRVTKKGLVSLKGPPSAPEPPVVPELVRQVRIHFLLPQDAPPLTGKFHVSDGSNSWEQNVKDNRAVFDVKLPARLEYRAPGLVGWTFNERNLKVEKGDGPLEIEQEVLPAGAISGAYHNAPVFEEPLIVRLIVVDHAKMPNGDPWINVESMRRFDEDRFFASPIPLNGSYRVVAWRGAAYAETTLLKVDDAHPLLEKDVTFEKGTNVSGKVLQPDGQPAVERYVEFHYWVDDHDLSWPLRTGLDGTLELRGINFNLTGSYSLAVPSSPGVAPVSMAVSKDSHDFKLQRVAGISRDVVVVDASDQPVQGVHLFAFPTPNQPGLSIPRDRVTVDVPSDSEGRAHFSTLKKGKYRIGAEGEYTLITEGPLALDVPSMDLTQSSEKPLRLRAKKR